MNANPSWCGVVVTFHPDVRAIGNLPTMAAECGRLLIVDNGSPLAARLALAAVPGAELIALPENLGVAAALNRGARRALEMGCRWIVTFDQDSTPAPGMVAALREGQARHPAAAIVGPCIIENESSCRNYRWVRRHPRWPWLFQRVECHGADLPEVTMMITSGSSIDLQVWTALGGFDEQLFIDYVDIDYCLNVIRFGRTIAVAAAARLHHRLGARQEGRLLGKDFRPTHHAAFRHYYMARNRVTAWRRHARAVPHWALFDLTFAFYSGFRVLAFERNKWAKLKAMVLGLWDGVRGRSGPCPPERRRAVEA